MNLHIYVHYKQYMQKTLYKPSRLTVRVHKYIQEIDLVRHCLILFADRTYVILHVILHVSTSYAYMYITCEENMGSHSKQTVQWTCFNRINE